jgi:hypothetical protein
MAIAPGLSTWRSLVAGLVRPAARRILVHAAVATAGFLVGAWALHRAWFAGGSAVLHGVGVVGLVPLFAVAGALTGCGLGVTSTLRALLARVEGELGRQLGPLVRQAVERALGAERAPSVAQFRAALDRHLDAAVDGGRGPRGLLARLLGGTLARLVRVGLERQLLRPLERAGHAAVTAEVLERFGRERLVGMLLDQARFRVTLAHAALLALASLATLGPLVYLMLRG